MNRYLPFSLAFFMTLSALAIPLRAAKKPRAGTDSRNAMVWNNDELASLHLPGLICIVRSGMARVLRVMKKASEKIRQRFISLTLVFCRRSWRKMLEHFVHALIEFLCVLVRVIGERIAR
jgi:hypothetical protein